MATASSPTSYSDDYSPRSSSTRSEQSYLPSQAAHTSPKQNTNINAHTPHTSNKLPQRGIMPSPNKFESKAPQLQNRAGQEDAAASSQRLRVGEENSEENSEDQNADPMADLPLKDWQELETRFERDMEAAIQHEQSIMDEIEWIMKACNI